MSGEDTRHENDLMRLEKRLLSIFDDGTGDQEVMARSERRVRLAIAAAAKPARPWRTSVAGVTAVTVALLGVAMLTAAVHSGLIHLGSTASTAKPQPTVATSLGTPVPTSQSSGLTPIGFVGTSTLRLITRSRGWAITETRIVSTADGGRHWSNRTPSGVSTSTIRGAFFLDSAHAWVTAPMNGGLNAYGTADGGVTWTSSRLGPLNAAYTERSAPAYVDFADSQHGWVVMVCATACPLADLYRTTDGGATWVKLSVPEGNPIYFASASDGWTYTGSDHSQLLVTHDGGANWHSELLGLPPGFETWHREYRLPIFVNEVDGVLPIELLSQRAFTVGFYVTNDGGRTWRATQPLASLSGSPFELPQVDVVTSALWTAAYSHQILRTGDGGRNWTSTSVVGTAPSSEVHFVNGQVGWGRRSGGECWIYDGIFPNGPPPQNCKQFADPLATTDGGRTWTKIDLGTN